MLGEDPGEGFDGGEPSELFGSSLFEKDGLLFMHDYKGRM